MALGHSGCLRCMNASGVPSACAKEIEVFVASGVVSAVVTCTSRGAARRQCEAYGPPSTPLRIRLVRIVLD